MVIRLLKGLIRLFKGLRRPFELIKGLIIIRPLN